MGEHFEVTRVTLESSNRNSIQHIWRKEIQPRVTHLSKSDTNSSAMHNRAATTIERDFEGEIDSDNEPRWNTKSDSITDADISLPKDANDLNAKEQTLSALETPDDTVPLPTIKIPPKLRNLPNVNMVMAYILNPKTRRHLAQLTQGKQNRLWDLLVASIISGAFGDPTTHLTDNASLNLVFPWVPIPLANKYNLTKKSDIVSIRDGILPLVLANRDALRENPGQLSQLIDAHNDSGPVKLERPAAAPEQDVVMYGKTFWPIEYTSYTYTELCNAVWFFDFIKRQFPKDRDATSISIQIRQMLNWIYGKNRGWAQTVTSICVAFESNPGGVCKKPVPPLNYGIDTIYYGDSGALLCDRCMSELTTR